MVSVQHVECWYVQTSELLCLFAIQLASPDIRLPLNQSARWYTKKSMVYSFSQKFWQVVNETTESTNAFIVHEFWHLEVLMFFFSPRFFLRISAFSFLNFIPWVRHSSRRVCWFTSWSLVAVFWSSPEIMMSSETPVTLRITQLDLKKK